MSGICGLVSLNGNIDLAEYSTLMLDGLGRFKHHSSSCMVTENAAIAQVNNHAHVLRGGPQHIRQADPWYFAGHARLDNRENVLRRHAMNSNNNAHVTDTNLIEMYLLDDYNTEFNEAYGDWVIAGLNSVTKSLVLAREHHGQKPLYYTMNNKLFAFSNAMESLLALPAIEKTFNERFIAKSMTRWSGEHDFETCFKNIFFLPPATVLKFTNNNFTLRRYWKFEEHIQYQNIGFSEAVDRTKESLNSAVKSRTSPQLNNSSMLSSGLDSASVTILASRQLKQHEKPIDAYCSVPLYAKNSITWKGRTADESHLAEKIANTQANVRFHTVAAADITPVTGIKMSLEATCQPFYATSNDHWINSLARQSSTDGNHVLLNGGMGNVSFSYDGRRAETILAAIAKYQFKRAVSKLRWKSPIVDFRRRMKILKTGNRPWQDYSPINSSFATRIDLTNQMKKTGHDPTFYTTNLYQNSVEERLAFISPKYGSGVLWDALSRTHGLDVLDPTSDTNLLLFLLGLPDNIFNGPKMERRWLAKQVADFLPDEILTNNVRGLQAADLVWKLKQEAENIDHILDQFAHDPYICDVIDVQLVCRIWKNITSAENNSRSLHLSAYGIFLNAIATGLFILKYK